MNHFSSIILDNIKDDNKYIKIEEGKYIIDYKEEGKGYIRTNLNLNIDKIEILNGIGVLIYNNNNIIKEFKRDKIKLTFNEGLNTISIILFDSYCGFNKFPDIYVYYNNDVLPEDNSPLYIYENIKYNIGDIVYPNHIGMFDDESNQTVVFSQVIIKSYLRELTNEKSNFSFEQLKEYCGFKIKDKVGNKFYIIEKLITDEEEFTKTFFATDEHLSNIEEIKEKACYIKDMIDKKDKEDKSE